MLQTKRLPANTKHLYNTFIQRRPNVFDVGPTVYKCDRYVLRLLGWRNQVVEPTKQPTLSVLN